MVALWRPATRPRTWRHDEYRALELFSGFGGMTQGLTEAGFTYICAANHNPYKVAIHEANHPEVEHWIADLANEDSPSYHSVRDLPTADLLSAGVSCVNHSPANTQKAYEESLSLFDLDDPDYEARVTRSERDRATANCVLHYAARHHPKLIVVECTTELASWGQLVPGRRKVGDGSTYRWWLQQFKNLGYRVQVLYLNSMFFGAGQSRNRGYWVMSKTYLPEPDLEHRPESWCSSCGEVVEAKWCWKTGVPATGSVAYGKQYNYRCPRCWREVVPPFTPALDALDLSDLGFKIGERAKPLAAATMARARRCLQRFREFPAIAVPGDRDGVRRAVAVDNFQGAARGLDEALPTQCGSETMALLSSGVLPFRRHTVPTTHDEAMPTVTASQIPGLLIATGAVATNDQVAESRYRSQQLPAPLQAAASDPSSALLCSGWFKQNGSTGTETAAHPLTDPLGTLTSRDTTGVLTARWQEELDALAVEDCYFRMLSHQEIGRGCGFDVDFRGKPGTFKVWGGSSAQVDGFGNAVTPSVSEWIGRQLLPAMHGQQLAKVS